MNLTINAANANRNLLHAAEQDGENGRKGSGRNIYGGNFNAAADPIAERKKEAQAQAWKVVSNAWKNDRIVDDSIQSRRGHYKEMEKLKDEALTSLKDIREDKEVLRELYGVEADSQEQKDLELLEKERREMRRPNSETFTEEEQSRLMELHKGPLTEYQQRAMEMVKQAEIYEDQIEDADRRMRDDVADIHSIQKERLKSNPMLEAQKAAEDIIGAANDEIKAMAIEEAREHIDEAQEKREEKAEEAMEEKEEREEQLEELKLKRAIQEALIERTKEAAEEAREQERENQAPEIEMGEMVDITKSNTISKDVGQSLSDIKSSMRLLEADLKGIKVDKEV